MDLTRKNLLLSGLPPTDADALAHAAACQPFPSFLCSQIVLFTYQFALVKMGRVAPQKNLKTANGQPANGVRGAKVQKQRKKHKVVLESAGDKGDDEKLRVVVRAAWVSYGS